MKHHYFVKTSVLSLLVIGLASATFVLSNQKNTQKNAEASSRSAAEIQVNTITQVIYGDCNGDQKIDAGDLSALSLETRDGDGTSAGNAGGGTFSGFETCDANYDYRITAKDRTCIQNKIFKGLTSCEEFSSPASAPGDCNGDQRVDAGDMSALSLEIADKDGTNSLLVHNGNFKGYRGCDANADTQVNKKDQACISSLIFGNSCQ